MSKKEFLKKLARALDRLPRDERNKTVSYYDEQIEDRKEAGATEEAAVDAMGDIDSIAESIIADARERGVSVDKKRPSGLVRALIIVLIAVSACAVLSFGVAIAVKGISAALGSDPIEWTEVHKDLSIEGINAVKIDMSRYDLFLGQSDDSMVHMTYYESDNVYFNLSNTNGTISLVQKTKGVPFSWITLFGSSDKRQAIVLIPEDFTGSVTSSVSTGDTRIDNLSASIAYEVGATTGDLIVYDTNAMASSFKTTTGDIIIGRCAFSGILEVGTTTGDIEMGVTESTSMSVHSTTGDITLERIGTGDLEVGLTTGEISLEDIKTNKLYAHSTTGAIGFKEIDAKDIEFKATTGSIGGTLKGSITDYNVESHVTTGKNTLPEAFGKGERKLKATATTGDIRIYFAEDV